MEASRGMGAVNHSAITQTVVMILTVTHPPQQQGDPLQEDPQQEDPQQEDQLQEDR